MSFIAWGDPQCPQFCHACRVDCRCERCNVCHACLGHYTGYTATPACGDYRHRCNVTRAPAPAPAAAPAPAPASDSSESPPKASRKKVQKSIFLAAPSRPRLKNFQTTVQMYLPQHSIKDSAEKNLTEKDLKEKGLPESDEQYIKLLKTVALKEVQQDLLQAEIEHMKDMEEKRIRDAKKKARETELESLRSRLAALENPPKPQSDDLFSTSKMKGLLDALPSVNHTHDTGGYSHLDPYGGCHKVEVSGNTTVRICLPYGSYDVHNENLACSEYFRHQARKGQSIDASNFDSESEIFQKFIDFCYQKNYQVEKDHPDNLAIHAKVYVLANQIECLGLRDLALSKAVNLCNSLRLSGKMELGYILTNAVPVVYANTKKYDPEYHYDRVAVSIDDIEFGPIRELLSTFAAENLNDIIQGASNEYTRCTVLFPKFAQHVAAKKREWDALWLNMVGLEERQARGLAVAGPLQKIQAVVPEPGITTTEVGHLLLPKGLLAGVLGTFILDATVGSPGLTMMGLVVQDTGMMTIHQPDMDVAALIGRLLVAYFSYGLSLRLSTTCLIL
ncbi:hypothetical protein TWF696_008505 [Orbilia brochopaga]|uniref:BTB domain-containing protein n=1 Tax=Orbilia brochopaga TaxID=3140254 RepID=A0AAV9UKM3_9PEZI